MGRLCRGRWDVFKVIHDDVTIGIWCRGTIRFRRGKLCCRTVIRKNRREVLVQQSYSFLCAPGQNGCAYLWKRSGNSWSITVEDRPTLSKLNLIQHCFYAVWWIASCVWEYFISISVQLSGGMVFTECLCCPIVTTMKQVVQNQRMLTLERHQCSEVQLIDIEAVDAYQLVWGWIWKWHFPWTRHFEL
jgi:hypothetical protein